MVYVKKIFSFIFYPIIKLIDHIKYKKKIKELQKLYSWNQFYQDRKMKAEMKKCQSDIHALKLVINELKNKKK